MLKWIKDSEEFRQTVLNMSNFLAVKPCSTSHSQIIEEETHILNEEKGRSQSKLETQCDF